MITESFDKFLMLHYVFHIISTYSNYYYEHYQKAKQLILQRAQQSIPGGVNSPVRAFKSVGGTPLFIKSKRRLSV